MALMALEADTNNINYMRHGPLIIIIIIIIMILLSEMENLFAQLIVGPAATEQRQIDVALSLSNVERQTG